MREFGGRDCRRAQPLGETTNIYDLPTGTYLIDTPAEVSAEVVIVE